MPHEDIISLTEFKSDASNWIKRLQHQPSVTLTQNGKGRAVVQSYDEFQRTRFETALLIRLNQALAEERDGRTIPQDKVFADIRAKLAKMPAENG